MMKADNVSYSSVALRFVTLFILLASLLVFPNSGCKRKGIGSTFKTGQLKYEVLTEDSASRTGTVSVNAASENISGDIAIPTFVTNGGINYSVTLIPISAFALCSNLTSIELPDSVTEIGYGAFYCCSSLTSIVIPDSVTEIGGMAFDGCINLGSVVIGKSVASIGNGAFSGCWSLTNIIIPDGVTSMGPGAFSGCDSLTEIIVGEANPNFSCLQGVLFNKDQTTLVQFPDGKKDIYTIPESVTSIGAEAFSGCDNLTSIIIPNNVTAIREGAFEYCCSLKSVTIGDSVTTIEGGAFWDCNRLTDVYFKGDAPELPGGNAFFHPSVIHYRPGTVGWTALWGGRPTREWVE